MSQAAEPEAPQTTDRADAHSPRLVWWIAAVAAITVAVSIGSPLLGLRSFHASDALLTRAPWMTHAPDPFFPTNDSIWDTINGYMPAHAAFRHAVLGGHFPLWTTYPAGGAPLGATPDLGTLSPMNLPYLLLPLWYAPGIAKLIEMAIALGFTYLFLRRVGLRKPASLVGGLIFAFSGFQVVWTNWPHTHIGALIPALFWAIEHGIQKNTASSVLAISLVVAVMLFEGFPSVAGYALVAGGIYAVARLALERGRPVKSRGYTLLLLGGAVALGVGLTALQVLPFVHRLGSLNLAYRQQEWRNHLPISALITLAIPNAFGSPIDNNYAGPSNYIEVQSFIGASSLILIAAAAAFPRRSRLVRGVIGYLWLGALVAVILIYAGGPILGVLHHLPLFGINFIGRLRSVLGFFLAALAAIGFEAATSARAEVRSGDRLRSILVWAAAAVLAVVGLASTWHIGVVPHAYLNKHTVIPIAAAVLTASLIALAAIKPKPFRSLALWLVPVVIAVEVLAFAMPFWPRIPVDRFYPTTPVHRYLLDHVGSYRIASAHKTLVPGTTTFYGLRALTAHTFYQPTWKELVRKADPRAFGHSQTMGNLAPAASVATSPILDRLSVRYFVTAPEDPVIGNTRIVSAPAGTVPLAAGSSLSAGVPNAAIRAVVVHLVSKDLPSTPSFLSVDLVDSAGKVMAHGDRRIFSTQPPGPFQVPIAEADLGTHPISARISLRSDGGSVVLAAAADGGPALWVVTAENDGLKLVFTDGASVYERTRALPRIRWASHAEVIIDPAKRIDTLNSDLPADTVILSRPGPDGSGDNAHGDNAHLEVLQDAGDSVRVAVTADGDGYVVVADAMQDGWRAYLDGKPTELRAADHAGVAVFVPAGEHQVVLQYHPAGWRPGVAISSMSLAILIAIAAFGTTRRKRRRRTIAAEERDGPSSDGGVAGSQG